MRKLYEKYYAGEVESVESILEELEGAGGALEIAGERSGTIDLESIEEMADAAPVRRLLNLVLLQAIKDKASDIHFEPFEDEFKIRYRIDGVLYEMVPPPKHLALAITSRIKVMANLDIAERRLPQDGRIELNVSGSPVDLRVSMLPTMGGESVVMRVLDRSSVPLDLNRLGLRQDDLRDRPRATSYKPHGIVLVTGPTGSGKTTTLYSALVEINSINDKIITTEDPVEYDLPGIMQVQVSPDIGVTFAACLRSHPAPGPRHHPRRRNPRPRDRPDGHPGGAYRAHRALDAAHQRRPHGRHPSHRYGRGAVPAHRDARMRRRPAPRAHDLPALQDRVRPDRRGAHGASASPAATWRARSSSTARAATICNNTGYKGRIGVFEIMSLNDEIRELITSEYVDRRHPPGCHPNGMRTAARSPAFWPSTTASPPSRKWSGRPIVE